jgi:hexosaminidase
VNISALTLVPRPAHTESRSGRFELTADLAISSTEPGWAAIARRLLAPGTGFELPAASDGQLALACDPGLGEEAYVVEVGDDGITLTAATARGLNWAVQTLRQLLPPSVLRPAPSGQPLIVDAIRVSDEPRFGWRGVHLDVGRHFMPLADLYRFVDLIALHKYNVFHLHLTEDQGWRFASARYPRLQEVASWRTETKRHLHDVADGTPHGGFYTADQLRSVVRYAADRGVAVLPELEFPGHVRAVLAAYPKLGNHQEVQHATATTFGVFDEVLNLQPETMEFVFDLFTELLEVFPHPYVHVGGDEVPRTEWLASERARARAAELGLPGPEYLQRWFTEQLRDWLAKRGRRLVGWDEINDEGPLEGAVAMAWRDVSYGIAAAEAGMDVVMTPFTHTYLDYYSGVGDDEPYAIGGLLPTEMVYAFEPLDGVPPELHHRVLGTQCQLWREYIPTTAHTDYMMFPRACAHSEVAWSDPADRSWPEFQSRLAAHLERLDAIGVAYRPEDGPLPWQRGGTGPNARPTAHRGG